MEFWKIFFESVFLGMWAALARLLSDTLLALKELAKAFPKPGRMLDVVSRWSTSLLGRVLAVPLEGIGEVLIARLTVLRLHNRLIRMDDAVRMFTRGPEEFIQEVTLTDESGIVSVWISAAARSLWSFLKRARLLWILQGQGEVAFVEAVMSAWKRRALRFAWLGLILAGFVVVVILSTYIAIAMWAMVFVKGLEHDYLLPQDSKRVWRKAGGVARRNSVRGPDEP